MRRRDFVAGLGVLAAIGWPVAEAAVPDGTVGVSDAFRRAVREDKLLLVFVVPHGAVGWEKVYQRQHVFGDLLTHASDETRRHLGSAVLVAATIPDLARLVPAAADLEGALFVLVDPRGVPAAVEALNTELPAVPNPYQEGNYDWDELQRIELAAVLARVQAVEKLLLDTLPEGSEAWNGSAPVGTEFWIESGCGAWPETPKEGDSSVGFGCGMGHVAAGSARFLNFLTLEGS